MFQENISLKKYNTFGIECIAKQFERFDNVNTLGEIIDSTTFKANPTLILGGGSNLLFTKDFDGLILKNELKGIEIVREDAEYVYVKAAAGEVWHDLVMFCVKNNYGGLENLSLIPGNVGASPMQNIGAYGVEIKDSFEELEAFSIEQKNIVKFNNTDCKFGYRESVFKNEAKGKYVITSVTYKLSKRPSFNTKYGAIDEQLERSGIKELSIKAISDAVIAIRSSKLPNPAELGNAGSFFKNPVVANDLFNSIKQVHPNVVGYPSGNDLTKLAAGWLIENCGLKGYTIGNCGVHKLQALVLVNYGGASGKEIFDLSSHVINSVKEKFGVELEREVNIY